MSAQPSTNPQRDALPAAYCQVIAQARYYGQQECSVTAAAGGATPSGQPYIAIRVGRVLLYVEDRLALASWTEAWRRALDLADGVFGPVDDAFTEVERVERRRFERAARHS